MFDYIILRVEHDQLVAFLLRFLRELLGLRGDLAAGPWRTTIAAIILRLRSAVMTGVPSAAGWPAVSSGMGFGAFAARLMPRCFPAAGTVRRPSR